MFQHRYSTIIPLFIIIGITDVVDGFLARRFGASSRRERISTPSPTKSC